MNDCEKLFLIAFGIVAASLQMIINIWEYSAAKREVAAGGDGDEDNKPVKRLHRGFQAASLVACCSNKLWWSLGAATLNKTFDSIQLRLDEKRSDELTMVHLLHLDHKFRVKVDASLGSENIGKFLIDTLL